MIKKILILFLLAILLFPNLLFCQQNDSIKSYTLDNVVIIANKFESSINDISSKVEIISLDKINSTNGNRLPDVLKNSSLVFIKSYGITPSLQTVSLNGLGAEHTVIMINGVKINSFQNAQVDLSLIPKENIHHIEILNNGESSIYGSDAIGGIINIITTNNSCLKNTDLNLSSSYSFGSFKTNRFFLGISKNFSNLDTRVYYSKETSAGSYEYYFNNGTTKQKKERENSAYSVYDIGFNSQYHVDPFNSIKFISTYSHQNKEVPGIETGTPPAKTKQKDGNWNNLLSVENIFSSSMSLLTTFNFQNNQMNFNIEPVSHSFYKNMVYYFTPELKWQKDDYKLATGYHFGHGNLISNEVDDGAKRNEHAIFISAGFMIVKGLRIFPSARFDYIHDIKKSVITYKAGINFQPIDAIDFSIKFNFGKNFRAPTFNDLYWKQSGNRKLNPENSFNTEIGFFYQHKSIIPIQFELTYINISAKDKIIWTPQRNLLWKPNNIASSSSNNFLFTLSSKKEVSNELILGFDSGINFTSSKKTSESFASDPTKDKYIPFLPLLSVKVSFTLEYNSIGFNLFYSHTSKRFSDFENKNSINPFNTMDGNIFAIIKIFEVLSKIKFEVNNITNTNYETISGYPMPLRYFLFTFSINY